MVVPILVCEFEIPQLPEIVNVANNDPNSHTSTGGAAYRHIIDASNPENSLFIAPPGQSGNIFSRFYDNFLKSWRGKFNVCLELIHRWKIYLYQN